MTPELIALAFKLSLEGRSTREIGAAIGKSHNAVAIALREHRAACKACATCKPAEAPAPVEEPAQEPDEAEDGVEDVPDVEALVAEGNPVKLEEELRRTRKLAIVAYNRRDLTSYNALARTSGILSAQLTKIMAANVKPADEGPEMVKAATSARANLRRMLDEALGRRVVEKEVDV